MDDEKVNNISYYLREHSFRDNFFSSLVYIRCSPILL